MFARDSSDSDRTACHLLCRGGFAKLSPLLEEMPDRAGGYIILGLTPETRSAESLVSLAVRLGLQTLLFAFSCMCCVDILGVCFEDGFCFFTAFAALFLFCFLVQSLHEEFTLLFFFAEKKKRSKKRKKKRSRLPLFGTAAYATTGSVFTAYQKHKSPGGVTGGCRRRNTAFLER